MSYKTYFPREKFSKNEIREFNIMYNIEYTNGINLKHLSLYLRDKVEENCMLISPGFRLKSISLGVSKSSSSANENL